MTVLDRAEVIIGGDDGPLQRALGRAESRMKKAGRRMQQAGRTLSTRVTLPLAAIGAASVKAFADFDSAMTQSIAIMGDVGDTMRNTMAAAARDVARTTTVSATQAAESYFFLASAGLDAQQSVAALPQVAAFAQAGMFDMATATDLATDAQSALGLAVGDAAENLENMTRVTDVLVRANTLANATVEQFSTALTTEAGAAMKTFGQDVEEGVAVLAAFADQGIKGQRAGSGYSRILRLMSQAAVNNKDEMEDLGIEFFDAQGNMRNMADVVENLTTVLGPMSDAQRAAALESIGFTARVQGIIQPLLGTSDAIREYEAGLRDAAGTTAEVAANQMKSFSAQMTLVKNEVILAAQAMGQTLAPVVARIGGIIRRGAQAFQGLSESTRRTIAVAGILAGALGPVLIVMGGIVAAGGALFGALSSVVGVFTSLTGLLNPVALGLGAIALALRQQGLRWADVKNAALNAWDAILATVGEVGPAIFGAMKPVLNFLIGAFASIGHVAVEAVRIAIEGWAQLWPFLMEGAKESGNVIVRAFGVVAEEVTRFARIIAFEMGNALGNLEDSEDEALQAMGDIGQRLADAATEGFGKDYVGGFLDVVGEGIDRAREMIAGLRGGGAGGAGEGEGEEGFQAPQPQLMLPDLVQPITEVPKRITKDFTGSLDRVGEKTKSVAALMGDQFTSAFGALISGTKSAGEAFADFAEGVLRMLAQMIAQAVAFAIISSFIPGFGQATAGLGALNFAGGFAHGGRIHAGQFGLVAEAGQPEMVSSPSLVQGPADVTPMGGGDAGSVAAEILARVGPPPSGMTPREAARDSYWREMFRELARDNSERVG